MARERFENAVAVVTGAGQGIGRATALRLGREGASVVVADRAEAPARAVAREIEAAGGRAHAAIHDLEQLEGARALFREAEEVYGRVDVSVHNVGGTIWAKPYWEYLPEQIEAEIQRSLWPTLWCCHAVLKLMLEAGAGSIVNVGSVATRGVNRVPYAAAKGGVAALTTALSLELGERPIRVNCVAPGAVDVGTRITPRHPGPPDADYVKGFGEVMEQTMRDTPMKRMGTPEEIAAAICFLASSDASYITGQTLYVAGGGIG
jgi:dihydroxycyclohexadiene carboxylate dehydrogenase